MDRSMIDREGDYWEDDYTSFYIEPQDYLYQVKTCNILKWEGHKILDRKFFLHQPHLSN
jgi:hypothetical protein